jgi:hypothetical protein
MDDITPIRKPEIIGEAGGLVDESRLTLGVHGEDLDPDEVSRLLGCAPTSSHRRGDALRSGRACQKGGWLLSVEAKSPTGPDELVHLLLSRLPTEQAVWADLRRRFQLQLTFGVFTERWNRGFDLTADAVRRIDVLGVGVGFDIYANLEEGGDG